MLRGADTIILLVVIANGGISCYDDVVRCLEVTGVDGVMSSEGLLENPALFSPTGDANYRLHYISQQLQIAQELIQLFSTYANEHSHFQLRGHLFKILYRITDAVNNQDFRKRLSEGSIAGFPELLHDMHDRYRRIDYDEKAAMSMGLLNQNSWYMRHRTEKAANRILSIPKFQSRELLEAERTGDEGKVKMEALKQRLLEKKKTIYENKLESSANS